MGKIQDRQQALLDIVSRERVFSQEELIQKLAERGISATQATLSRDLKALNLVKVSGQGYVLPQEKKSGASSLAMGIVSLEINGNIGVLHTQPGLAPAIALMLDRKFMAPVMGTIAGDDTVLLAFRQGFSANQILEAFSKILPDIRDRYIQIPE